MSETKVTVPTVSQDEIVQAAQNLANHAKDLFLRGAPEEAAAAAHKAAHFLREIDTEASSKLKSLAARFLSHVPAPATPAARPAH